MNHWLMKSEPDVYGIDHLERDGSTPWSGVRNYRARNFMRDDMAVGDRVLFYHSRSRPPGVVGIAEVTAAAHPDATQFDPDSDYHDPKATREEPRWFCVDVGFVRRLARLVPLDELKADPALDGLLVAQKGQRLSIMPVDAAHYEHIVALGDAPTD